MKTNEMNQEVKTFIENILEKEFYFDKKENGIFYLEIYADYRDLMANKDASDILQSEDPEQKFYEWIDRWYLDSVIQYESEISEKVKTLLAADDGPFPEGLTDDEENEIDEYLRGKVFINVPENHYFGQEFYANIMVDTGDGNTDYTLNSVYPCYYGRYEDKIDNRASIVWLAKRQGYCKTQLQQALRKENSDEPKGFLESMRCEVINLPSCMAALTFLVKMTLRDLMELNKYIRLQDRNGHYYDQRKNPDCGYIVIDKKAETGLFDPWSGGGSMFEIELEKDVRLPIKFIRSALPDGADGYSVESVYGMPGSCWRDVVKEIHGISKERLAKEAKIKN